jgi:propionyl-CoA carboxylase beta chain
VYRRELERAQTEQNAGNRSSSIGLSFNKEEIRKQKIQEFRDRFANPYIAAERGYVDAVIQPRDTRRRLIQALEMLQNKRDKNPPKKHGNIPL